MVLPTCRWKVQWPPGGTFIRKSMAPVGALSVVPKHRTLEPHSVYGGVPAKRLDAIKPAQPLGETGLHPRGDG